MANMLLYLFWYFVTLGNYKIIYLKKNDEIVHYTHILPKFFKLTFLNVNDLEIGPSWTKESYRGKGIFPANYTLYSGQYLKREEEVFIFFLIVIIYPVKKLSRNQDLKCGLKGINQVF